MVALSEKVTRAGILPVIVHVYVTDASPVSASSPSTENAPIVPYSGLWGPDGNLTNVGSWFEPVVNCKTDVYVVPEAFAANATNE